MRRARDFTEELENVLVLAKTGTQVPITEVADIENFATGASMIRYENGQLVGFVFVDLKARFLCIADYTSRKPSRSFPNRHYQQFNAWRALVFRDCMNARASLLPAICNWPRYGPGLRLRMAMPKMFYPLDDVPTDTIPVVLIASEPSMK